MAETVDTVKWGSILDWLESVFTGANSQLFLDIFGGSASPPPSSLPFLTPPSTVSHARVCSTQSMAYNLLDPELILSQEAHTYYRETPTSSQSLRAVSTESLPHHLPPKPEKLGFLALDDWDPNNSYDEEVPTRLHWSLEWKVSVNNKMISKNTEQDQVLHPTAYWHMILKPNLDKLLQRKVAQNRHIRCEDTTVVASVNHRNEPDVTKQFENINIDWSVIEKQMIVWGELFRYGKRLRVNISFNYIDSQPPVGTIKRGSKRGSSATQRMLSDRDAQLDAEADNEGQASAWQTVYALMRCPGPPCDLGPHCWIDPIGKKHYKLRTHHLRALVEDVEKGKLLLRSHDDVPDSIRRQLVAEEQQRLERQPNRAGSTPTSFPPINITNVLPSSYPPSTVGSVSSSDPLAPQFPSIISLDIPGPRDTAVRKYSEWQQLNVVDEGQKKDYQEACNIILGESLDLELVSEKSQEVENLIQKGIKRGVAWRFIHDIPRWAKRQKQSHNTEELD